MRFAALDHRFTGVAVPVSSLRTAESCGVGEFADLPLLGEWCRDVGLEAIQILPVNDTGTNSSPYSALSAFALHPLYLRLQDIPGARRHAEEIAEFARAADERQSATGGRFDYGTVLRFKLSIVERLFGEHAAEVRNDKAFALWRKANPWIGPYAAFTVLKKERGNAPWGSWASIIDPTPADIAVYWDARQDACLLAAWTQYILEQQLSGASRALAKMGVFLKGDIPILMSEESVDLWASRRYFDLSTRAGAPPDMFSPLGQNWGFPVYAWDRLAKDGYQWWNDRLRQAAKFFHAIRIDHVLGFFRIWSIPRGERTGLLGRFSPSAGISARELRELGFDDGRIRWLSVPHISCAELDAGLGGNARRVADLYLERIDGQELFNIKPGVDNETAIHALPEPQAVKDFLSTWHANRVLLDPGTGEFFPAWYLDRTKGFQTLGEAERHRLRGLLDQRRKESEDIWEARGRRILAMLKNATDMLVCAEDLGDVPNCVPRSLADLGILGLRIVRWSREYAKSVPGLPPPFIAPVAYPRLSVCTPSVHDTSTLRAWWEEDASERGEFLRSMGGSGACPPRMSVELLERAIAHCLDARSLLCMFQIQDLLDLDETLQAPDPKTDRINVPGTVSDFNWTWRMPLRIEELMERRSLTQRLRRMIEPRRQTPLEGS